MSESHTPEPWRVSRNGMNVDAGPRSNGERVANTPSGYAASDVRRSADAHRIVACVNALAGVPTAVLESGAVGKLVTACEDAAAELSRGLSELCRYGDHDASVAAGMEASCLVLTRLVARLKGGAA